MTNAPDKSTREYTLKEIGTKFLREPFEELAHRNGQQPAADPSEAEERARILEEQRVQVQCVEHLLLEAATKQSRWNFLSDADLWRTPMSSFPLPVRRNLFRLMTDCLRETEQRLGLTDENGKER